MICSTTDGIFYWEAPEKGSILICDAVGWLFGAGAMPADFMELHADELDVRLCNTFAVLHMATSAGKVVVSLSEGELERLSLRIQMETARQAGRQNMLHIPSV